jgi:hypothetical protein
LTRHKHEWLDTFSRASPFTTGAGGRGRTIAYRRKCATCGRKERRTSDWTKLRTGPWVEDKDEVPEA